MIEKYHKPIFEVISRMGALGVNQIAKETDLPVSTIQAYLTKQQSYFKKNDDRKWDLPENVVSEITDNSLTLSLGVLENAILLIESQLREVVESFTNIIIPLNTLKKGLKDKPAPVADTIPKGASPKLRELMENVGRLPTIIKTKKSNLTPEQYDLLLNTEWLNLILDLGANYFRDEISPSLYELLLGSTAQIPEDILDVLNQYQIGQNSHGN